MLAKTFLTDLEKTDRVGIALSGGGDSVALLKHLQKTLGAHRVVALHFNHNLRPDADADQAWVEQLCTSHNVPCLVGHWENPAHSNTQQAARMARYQFLSENVKTLNLKGVCVGHTKDDVAETLLMRLGRGSGVQGLASMHVVTKLMKINIYRPFLEVSRKDLRTYLKAQNQIWLEDPNNQNKHYLRPRVREGIATLNDLGLPARALADAAVSIQRADVALNHVTDAFLKDFSTHDDIKKTTRIADNLLDQPDEIAQRVLEKVILTLKPAPLAPRVSKRLRLIEGLRDGETTATLGGVKFQRVKNTIMCTPAPAVHSNANTFMPIPIATV